MRNETVHTRMEHALAMITIELFPDQFMVAYDCTRGPFTFGRAYKVCALAPATCKMQVVYTIDGYTCTGGRAKIINRFKYLWAPAT